MFEAVVLATTVMSCMFLCGVLWMLYGSDDFGP